MPSGNKHVGIHDRMGMKFASKFIGALVVKARTIQHGDASEPESLEASQEEDMGMEAESSDDLHSQSEDLAPYDEAMERDSDEPGSAEGEEYEGSRKQAKGSKGGKFSFPGQSVGGTQQEDGNETKDGGTSSTGEGRGKEHEEGSLTAVSGQGLRGGRAASKGPAVINQQVSTAASIWGSKDPCGMDG
eukprot:1154630-Pelagomonas_calceolata.AAC.5